MSEHEPWNANEFLNVAGAFQAGMVLVALLAATWLNIDVWDRVAWSTESVGWGLAGILPLCAVSRLIDRIPWEPFRQMERTWSTILGPAMRDLTYTQLVTLALLVGISEELLFRGVLQVSLLPWGWWPAMIITSVAFGLAHAMTPTYAVCAGLIGVYLSAVMELTTPPNLLIPILCHAGCDLYAFVQIKHEQLRLAS